MQPSEYTFDLYRIFIGEFPPMIYVEILLRVIILYVTTIVFLRIFGKRASKQMTIIDVVIIIALGSAVGDPMFYPEISLLFGIMVIFLVTALQTAVSYLTFKNKWFHSILESSPELVIKDGKIDKEVLTKEKIAKEDLFMKLREEGVRYLEEVERCYVEPSGGISLYKNEKVDAKKTSILPEDIGDIM